MGRRAIFTVVLLGSLIAAGQMWVVSAMLSKPLASGKTGWERVATARERKQKRSLGMPLVEGVSVQYHCGTAVLGALHPDDRFTVNLVGEYPAGSGALYGVLELVTPSGKVSLAWVELSTPLTVTWPMDMLSGDLSAVESGTYPIQFRAIDWQTGQEVEELIGQSVTIDKDTLPTFSNVSVGISDCGPPISPNASVEIQNADSWSYQLYDGGNPISGGSPGAGTHELDGCSGYASVTNLPSNADRITFTATNGNGSSTVSSNLDLPSVSVSIEADPPSIFEEQETTLNWSATYASTVQIDNGIGVVGVTANPWINELSGSVAVSPMETTTYTITALGLCQEVTSQVTVTVSPPPTRHYLKPNPGGGTAWSLVPEPCD